MSSFGEKMIKKMFSFEFSLKERFYLSRTDFWLFNLTVRWLSAKQHKQVRFLQEPQLKVIKNGGEANSVEASD